MSKPAHVWTGVTKREVIENEDQRKHPWLFRCPAPMCFWNTAHRQEKDAQTTLETHPCPWFAGGDTKLGWGVMAASFVEPIWKLLDEQMDRLAQIDSGHPEWLGTRAQARAYANTLAILMPPFFTTADDIAREAKKRYDMRKAGTDYETPGLGRLRYEPAGSTLVKQPGVPNISNEVRESLKGALASGLFPPEQLAKMYNVSMQTLAWIQKEG